VKLEEAREIVQNMRNRGRALNKEGDILSEIAIALIILDNRITELEAQRDELKKEVKYLKQIVRQREAHLNVIERMSKASDKEK